MSKRSLSAFQHYFVFDVTRNVWTTFIYIYISYGAGKKCAREYHVVDLERAKIATDLALNYRVWNILWFGIVVHLRAIRNGILLLRKYSQCSLHSINASKIPHTRTHTHIYVRNMRLLFTLIDWTVCLVWIWFSKSFPPFVALWMV